MTLFFKALPYMHVEGKRTRLPHICKALHRTLPLKGHSSARRAGRQWSEIAIPFEWVKRLRLTEVIQLIRVHTTDQEQSGGFWFFYLLLSSHRDKWLYRNRPIRCQDVPHLLNSRPCVSSLVPPMPGTGLGHGNCPIHVLQERAN